MKILSIEFQNHSILGNLKLDFTDKKGNPVDTIILAGENGCGKTTILEEISNLWSNSQDILNRCKQIKTQIHLDKNEITTIIQNYKEVNPKLTSILTNVTGFFEVISNLPITSFRNFDIKCQQFEKKDLLSLPGFIMADIKPFAQSIFSPVDINYHSQNITSITATSIDSDVSIRKKSNENLATVINQLLVDAEASDASEALSWFRENPTQIMPQNLVSPRIKRFSNAFSKMFDDIEFSRVDNVQSIKTIFFKRGNTEIPISKLSSGEKQIVYRGAYLLKDIQLDIGKTVLIDEPEISMHPIWQKKILGYYQGLFSDEKGNQLSQIFVATHSPFIIHNDNRHNDKVIVLKRNSNGDIYQTDKSEYYDCNSCKVIEDSFSVNDFSRNNMPFVFLEGRTDEMYFNKAKELFGQSKSNYTFQWVGYLKENDAEEFTGKDALNKLKSFILGNPNVFGNGKNILLYDCDTNKETKHLSNNLIIKTLPKQNGQRYKIGVENLLILPHDFDYNKYYETKDITCDYGEHKSIQEFKKMDLAKDICKNYSEVQQRNILRKIGDIVTDIEKELFGENNE